MDTFLEKISFLVDIFDQYNKDFASEGKQPQNGDVILCLSCRKFFKTVDKNVLIFYFWWDTKYE